MTTWTEKKGNYGFDFYNQTIGSTVFLFSDDGEEDDSGGHPRIATLLRKHYYRNPVINK